MGEPQFGVKHYIGAPIPITRLPEQSLVCIPPRTAKFTLPEWKLRMDQLYRNTEDQQHLADRILKESERLQDETTERSEIMKDTSDRRIEQRIGEVAFNRDELSIQRKEICLELENLGMYKTRLQDCLANLQENMLSICRKCLMLRDGRIGIDLVVDPVEEALQTEITSILGGQSLLKRALEQLHEQVRRLKATRYMLDRDLQYKQGAIDTYTNSLNLKPFHRCLSIYEGYGNLDPASITADEYDAYSANNIKLAAREVTSARPIRVYIDTLLKQVFEDLWDACKKCNFEFQKRIETTKRTLETLEDMHFKTSEKVIAMHNNIMDLKKNLVQREGYTGLCHTRLGRHAQRVGGELVRDPQAQALYSEAAMLRYGTEQLQQMLHEANSSLRYLLQTQIALEEDISIKLNTLKIDEVDCMTLRKGMIYYKY